MLKENLKKLLTLIENRFIEKLFFLKPIIIVIILIVFISSGFSRKLRYPAGVFIQDRSQFSELDKYARNTKPEHEKDVKTLVKYLIKPARNELQKARVIWSWITSHIAYDIEGYPKRKRKMIGSAEETFAKRMGVCIGYSRLYRQMAQIAGLESLVITGNVKLGVGTGGGIGHAWNIVRVDNKWYMLDATWGAGVKINPDDLENVRFEFSYNESWFLTDPRYMVFTHYPMEYEMQLLKEPVNPNDFVNFPVITTYFTDNMMWFTLKPEGNLLFSDGDSFTITSPEDMDIMAVAVKENYKSKARITRKGTNVTIEPITKFAGRHVLYIMGKRKGEKQYSLAAIYNVIMKKKQDLVSGISYGGAHEIKVILPKVRKIPAGKEIIFRFYSSGTDLVIVKNGNKTWNFKGSGNYDFRIPIQKGKVIILGRIQVAPVFGKDLRPIIEYEAE